MKPIFFLTAAAFITGSAAFAGLTVESIAADLQAQGFSRIEITQGRSQIKAEATRGGERVDTVYDAATGDVIRSETRLGSSDDNRGSGVSIRSRDRDFVRDSADDGAGDSRDDRDSGSRGNRNRNDSDDSDRSDDSDHNDSDHNDSDRNDDSDRGDDNGGDHDNGDDHDNGGDTDND